MSTAITTLAARTKVSDSSAVLAAVGALLATWTGHHRCAIYANCHNRFQPELAGYVGALAQEALIPFELTSASFHDVVRRTHLVASNAHRYGFYDSRALTRVVAQVSDERGVPRHRDCIFNDVSGHQSGGPVDASMRDAAQVRRALRETGIAHVSQKIVEDPFRFTVYRIRPTAGFMLSTERRMMGVEDVERFIRGVERLLVAAADGDVAVSALADLTGVRPSARGSDWAHLDGWVDLAAAQAILEAVVTTGTARIFAVPADQGRHSLVAYVAANDRSESIVELHAAYMDKLVNEHAVCAPHRYVLCRSAPDSVDDPDAWQRQPFIAAGSGRLPGQSL